MSTKKSGGKPADSAPARQTKMAGKASSRVQSAGDKNPSSKTATTGFKARAQSAAAKNGKSGKK